MERCADQRHTDHTCRSPPGIGASVLIDRQRTHQENAAHRQRQRTKAKGGAPEFHGSILDMERSSYGSVKRIVQWSIIGQLREHVHLALDQWST